MSHDNALAVIDFDDYLGSSDTRFFSAGYKASNHVMNCLEPSTDGLGFSGNMTVTYAAGWSQKAGVDQPPHLSTVDVMVLGVQSAYSLISQTFPEDAASDLDIVKIVIIAGNVPNTELTGLPVSSRIVKFAPDDPLGEIVIETVLGSMKSRITAARRSEIRASGSHDYWHGEYRQAVQMLGPAILNRNERTVSTSVVTRMADSGHVTDPTKLDAFVSLMQLGQILLYDHDQITREQSNTLWMQQVVLTSSENSMPGGYAVMGLVEAEELTLNSSRWTNATFEGYLGNIALSATFAHQLPQRQNGEAN